MKDKITITLDAEVLQYLQEKAESDSRSISSLVNKIVKDDMQKAKSK